MGKKKKKLCYSVVRPLGAFHRRGTSSSLAAVEAIRSDASINQPFIVLTETKFSYRYIPVWARYSPHRTRVEAHANMLSP